MRIRALAAFSSLSPKKLRIHSKKNMYHCVSVWNIRLINLRYGLVCFDLCFLKFDFFNLVSGFLNVHFLRVCLVHGVDPKFEDSLFWFDGVVWQKKKKIWRCCCKACMRYLNLSSVFVDIFVVIDLLIFFSLLIWWWPRMVYWLWSLSILYFSRLIWLSY